MAFKKDSRKRRSDRLMFMIPLRAEGLTEAGEAFECGGHALAVNRFGAHIRLERPVSVAHKIRLTNLENNLRGEFRIVNVLESPTGEETDFGVEALGNYSSFWGIDFPAQPGKPGESRGLLECQHCRSASLQPLSLDEIEVLESGGTVKKPCASCRSRTAWRFAMEGTLPGRPLPEPEPPAPGEGADQGREKKAPRTVFMQRPVSIRTASGQEETVQTENLSKDEIRCTSEKNYEVNQAVTLEWENSGTGQRLRVQGRIRRRQLIAGSRRMIYSIRHEGSPVTLPPSPLKSARWLYIAMGGLVAAASVLMAIAIQGLAFSLEIPSGAVAYRIAHLGGVLLLLSVAYKFWKAIQKREPDSRRPFKRRHLMAASLAAVLFLGSLAAGAMAGLARGFESQRTQLFLHHLAVAGIFERNIDAAENRVMASPPDYADACATLRLLAGQWQRQLDAITAVGGELSRARLWRNAKFRRDMNGLDQIIGFDRRKLSLVQEQIALETVARSIDPDKRQAFWRSSFPPLRQKILELDARKNQVVKSLIAQK
jgi:hypothetical protein